MPVTKTFCGLSLTAMQKALQGISPHSPFYSSWEDLSGRQQWPRKSAALSICSHSPLMAKVARKGVQLDKWGESVPHNPRNTHPEASQRRAAESLGLVSQPQWCWQSKCPISSVAVATRRNEDPLGYQQAISSTARMYKVGARAHFTQERLWSCFASRAKLFQWNPILCVPLEHRGFNCHSTCDETLPVGLDFATPLGHCWQCQYQSLVLPEVLVFHTHLWHMNICLKDCPPILWLLQRFIGFSRVCYPWQDSFGGEKRKM